MLIAYAVVAAVWFGFLLYRVLKTWPYVGDALIRTIIVVGGSLLWPLTLAFLLHLTLRTLRDAPL